MIKYHIYMNDGAGGPVDYGAVVAMASGPPWSPALPLPFGSDVTYAVRAFDDVTGLEERNRTAAVRVVTGPAGEDLSGRPLPPLAVAAFPVASGSAVVSWVAPPGGSVAAPTGFDVYVGSPTPSYAAPAASVPAARQRVHYSAAVSGLTAGLAYQAVVRSRNAAGPEANTAAAGFTLPAAGPSPVESGGSAAVGGTPPDAGFPPLPPF